jgi:hypothetical protein
MAGTVVHGNVQKRHRFLLKSFSLFKFNKKLTLFGINDIVFDSATVFAHLKAHVTVLAPFRAPAILDDPIGLRWNEGVVNTITYNATNVFLEVRKASRLKSKVFAYTAWLGSAVQFLSS